MSRTGHPDHIDTADAVFDHALRARYAEAVARVSPQTRARLRAGRHAATARPRCGWWLAGAATAALALALVLPLSGPLPGPAPAPVAGATLAAAPAPDDPVANALATADPVATLAENPDLYVWLAANEDLLASAE